MKYIAFKSDRPTATSRWLATALMLLSLGGCALMREDSAPLTQRSVEQIRLAEDIKLARDGWPQAQWWHRYGDAQLDALVARGLQHAPAMSVARARVETSRAQAELTDASHGLLVGFTAALNRQSVSENGFLAPFSHKIPALGATGPWYTEGTIGLVAEYSVDLWGKDRARTAAAIGVHNAHVAEAAQTELLLSSQIVRAYYEMQTLFAVEALLQQARDIEDEAVTAHQAKAERGLEPRTPGEVALAHRLELDRQITAAQTRIRSRREMLRALVGAGPDDFPAISAVPLPGTSSQLPATLGYELLARRPDLQAMRWYVQASFDQVEVAKAAFYPSFDIRAFLGLDALRLEDLFRKSSRQLNLIPGLSLPVFDSGRLNANLAVARSQSNTLIAEYNQSVLNAVREVAQASIELASLERQANLQDGKLKAAAFAYDSAQSHYRRGLLDKVSAAEAKLPVLLEQGTAVELRSRQIHAEVALTTVLGGGYADTDSPSWSNDGH